MKYKVIALALFIGLVSYSLLSNKITQNGASYKKNSKFKKSFRKLYSYRRNRHKKERPVNMPIDRGSIEKYDDAKVDLNRDKESQNVRKKVKEKLSENEIADMDEYFEKIENTWKKNMENLFLEEFNLSENDVETYMKIRDAYEKERYEAFESFHREMLEKHGEEYSYRPSEEENSFSHKIKEEYLDQLRKLIGENNFQSYLEALDNYNEKLRESRDPELGVLVIDL